jgi:hypothetical protein
VTTHATGAGAGGLDTGQDRDSVLRLLPELETAAALERRDAVCGIAQAGSAMCRTLRRRESNHAPGAGPRRSAWFRCRQRSGETRASRSMKALARSTTRLRPRTCARAASDSCRLLLHEEAPRSLSKRVAVSTSTGPLPGGAKLLLKQGGARALCG